MQDPTSVLCYRCPICDCPYEYFFYCEECDEDSGEETDDEPLLIAE